MVYKLCHKEFISKAQFFYHWTLFSNYCNFLSIFQNSLILVRLERFQRVKFKSEKFFLKEPDEKVRILHFYWSENLKTWIFGNINYQNIIQKSFLDQQVWLKFLPQKRAKNDKEWGFLAKITSKLLPVTSDPKLIF